MATAISGTGPTYVFLLMEALVDAGVHLGFSRREALTLVTQTVIGSAKFAQQSHLHLAELRNMVTSPGGTSAEAIYQLEKGGLLPHPLPEDPAEALNELPAASCAAEDYGQRSIGDIYPLIKDLTRHDPAVGTSSETIKYLLPLLPLGLVSDGGDEEITADPVDELVVPGEDDRFLGWIGGKETTEVLLLCLTIESDVHRRVARQRPGAYGRASGPIASRR